MIGCGYIVENDLYGISREIKRIDSEYFVFFRYKTGKFEVHHRGQRGNTLAVVLPFDRLDMRSVAHVRKTRCENIARLLQEIEESNQKLSHETAQSLTRSTANNFERVMRGKEIL